MKKLITTSKPSEIHIDELNSYSVILVKKNGEFYSAIQTDECDDWVCSIPSTENYIEENELSDLLKNSRLKGCEFYVI